MLVCLDLCKIERNKQCGVGERLCVNGSGFDWVRDSSKTPTLGAETKLLQLLFQTLHGSNLTQSMDKWVWDLSDNRDVMISALRHMVESNRNPVDLQPIQWSNWVPLKVRCFNCKIILNKIPSTCALIVRRVNVESEACSMCFR